MRKREDRKVAVDIAASSAAVPKVDADELTAYTAARYVGVLRTVLQERFRRHVVGVLNAVQGEVRQCTPKKPEGAGLWIGIESLSMLRGLVGGRFQQLKQRWLEAGLPLREHRGDRDVGVQISPEGWEALSHWIFTQGFEARVAPTNTGQLFEVRPLSKSNES